MARAWFSRRDKITLWFDTLQGLDDLNLSTGNLPAVQPDCKPARTRPATTFAGRPPRGLLRLMHSRVFSQFREPAMQFEQLGPYRLGKKLGQGGMGAVYEGVEITSGEAAAIKVLSPALAADEGFRVRFESEIESLKKLRHPNIVRLLGYGEQAGTLFYAMELVHGTSLEDELRCGRRFAWREVTRIAVKLCRALKHAHDHGIIHRDLKPANLLLTADGDVKLSDFGIARLFGNTRLTSDGGVLGTAEYMAPEQAEGSKVTDRTDQYSLGGVMYALLAGRPPFRADTLVEMLQMQRYAEPEPLARFAPDTPDELARIVHQLLEKDPQRRFPNALILSRSLEAMERGLSVSRPDDFVLAPPGTLDPGASGYDALAPTLSPDQLRQADKQRRSAGATEATMAYAPPGEKSSAAPPDDQPPDESGDDAPDRFTRVQEGRDEPGRLRDALAALVAPQTLALVAGLAILVAGGWYLMQPPGADQLFDRIATAEGDPEKLQAARHDMDDFLARFPGDPRADKVRSLADEARQSGPIERAYAEALRHVLFSPEVALMKFQALIDVYDDGPQGSEVARHYVRLARQQTAKLQKRVDRQVDQGRKLIESRLEKAAAVAPDDPPAARRIYEGIVELYRDKPWADDLVRRAQNALDRGPKRQTAAD
jgi:serine/threonine-protein kinase